MARKTIKTQTTAAKATSSTPKRRTTAPIATGVKVPATGSLKRAAAAAVAEQAPISSKAEAPVATPVASATAAPSPTIEMKADAAPAAAAVAIAPAPVEAPAPAAPSPELTASLRHTLRGDDADAARNAAESLGTAAGDPAAVDALAEVLWNHNGYYHAVVRSAAAAALGQLRDPRGVDALLFAVRDPMAEASAEAIRALARIGDPRAADAVVDVVRNRDNYFLPFVRRVAVEALGQLGGARAYDELRAVANAPWEDPAVREAAQAATRDDTL